jgi:hypothetical protein
MVEKEFKIEKPLGTPVTDQELIDDLLRVAKELNKDTVGMKEYDRLGKHVNSTFHRRFGTWNKALTTAGLSISNEVNLSDERLFENILTIWQHYGRQPVKRDLSRAPSTISERPYFRRFGSWWKALEAFVEYANGNEDIHTVAPENIKDPSQGPRDPSMRLRWQVLKRDRFTCQACGASPALKLGVELHVDHIVAWAKGGATVLENLQTLCSNCNWGKGDT